MEEYLIKPWAARRQEAGTDQPAVDWDMQVPPEVDALAEAVIRQYDMSVSNRTLITSKPDKGGAIWKIETNKGPRSLKLLHRTPERSMFSVGLQDYVVKKGARVPALIPAKDGKLYVEKGGKLWIVTDWIDLQPASKVDLAGAQELCYGLGEFHRHTKGYIPPAGAKNSSRLYRWPRYYQKIIKKIGWMREVAKCYRETAASAEILAVVDQYEAQAREALTRLEQSAYFRMVAMGEPYWGLVHQDYGFSNGQKGPGGLWVIDLDGVAYDLPFRDLRKLITGTMDDMGVWDLTWIRGMIDAYHQANPLDAESFEVLLIDMALPNEFYKHLKEMFYDPVTFLNTEVLPILQRVVSTDRTKSQALAELAQEKGKYKPGAYQVQVPAAAVEKGKMASGVAAEEKVLQFVPPKEQDVAPTPAAGEQLSKSQSNVIDLVPYLRKQRKAGTLAKKRLVPGKGRKVQKRDGNSQKRRNAAALSGRTRVRKPVLQRSRKLAGSGKKRQLAGGKLLKLKPLKTKTGRNAGAAKQATRRATRRHRYKKVAAPLQRNRRHLAQKLAAKPGRKKLVTLR